MVLRPRASIARRSGSCPALAGAAYGGNTVPFERAPPAARVARAASSGLSRLAYLTANGGRVDGEGWPTWERLPSYVGSSSLTVPHPDDPGVLLGAVGALQPAVADAVVSLCRLGLNEVPLAGCAAEDHTEVWLVDQDDSNNDLPRVLSDAAAAVQELRKEGKTELLHCVHAHSRTPIVAAAYGALVTGNTATSALDRVLRVLPAHPRLSIAAVLDALSRG